MQIRIKNQIQLDGHTELIDQVYDTDWTQKGDFHYLLYKNEEGEKVVLKFHDKELVMTRFSEPKSIMRFISHIQKVRNKKETCLLTSLAISYKAGNFFRIDDLVTVIPLATPLS